MSTAPVCSICHKPYYDDGSYTTCPELCKGHNNQPDPWGTAELVSIKSPDYSLVLERIAFALEDIANRLGYLRSIAK